MLESGEQKILAEYLDLLRVRWCHVPNGGLRNLRVAMDLKAQGVKTGVPDVLVFTRPPHHPQFVGTAIELKKPDGVPSDVSAAQSEWLAELHSQGWATFVCFGASDAIGVLRDMGYGRAA